QGAIDQPFLAVRLRGRRRVGGRGQPGGGDKDGTDDGPSAQPVHRRDSSRNVVVERISYWSKPMPHARSTAGCGTSCTAVAGASWWASHMLASSSTCRRAAR